ncbi:MAG: hypothetical protein IJ165_12060 [Proteobacteria bacterium]|nr:hypothetical protein [Pseudomonadota bacterium]
MYPPSRLFRVTIGMAFCHAEYAATPSLGACTGGEIRVPVVMDSFEGDG